MKIFVISDPHFNHSNIIPYTNRPFSSVKEMDEAIIANWNKTVGPDDTVFCLGDFCFGTKDNIPYYTRQLNGRKILIRGNHDRTKSLYIEAGFQDVMGEYVLHPHHSGFNRIILFTHKPRIGMDKFTANIHGHIHDQLLDPAIFELENYFNVSVENINYTPIELQEIIRRMGW